MRMLAAVPRGPFLGRGDLIATLLVTITLTLAVPCWLGVPPAIGARSSDAIPPEPVTLSQGNPIGQPGRTIDFRVMDQATGKPLPGVRLTVTGETTQILDRTTGETGAITFNYPSPRPRWMQVRARKEGFTPMVVWFHHPAFGEEFPAAHTLTMPRVAPIGGVVKDEQGRPVSGVKVSPRFMSESNHPWIREGFQLGDEPVTDAEGRWTLANMPSGYDPAQLGLRIRHADFEPFAVHGGKVVDAIGPKGTVILRRGIAVVGQVVDRQGQPVHGARVSLGPTSFDTDRPIAQTDHDGRFRLEHLPPGETILTAQAKAHAPELIKVEVHPGMAPLGIRLGVPRTVQGRVLDPQGKPIAGVQVSADEWRGARTLEWKSETGADGSFRWDDVPRDLVRITAIRDGFISLRNREVPASEAETILKMARVLTIAGTVVDSRTRKPIESFTLIPGFDREDGTIVGWNRGESRRKNGGRYEIRFTEPMEAGHRLRIEAEGYAPGISRLIADREGNVRLDFALVASKPITGVVRLPEGRPVDGADVMLVVPSTPAFIDNGRPPSGRDQRVVRSGPDGRYTFPPEEPPFSVLALHDLGFALVRSSDLARDGKVVIQPWGRIEGTLRVGSRPGAGLSVVLFVLSLGDAERAEPAFSYVATADPSGKFIFERVVPGFVSIGRKIDLNGGSYTLANKTEIEVKPNTTTRVSLGGTGLPVIGRVIVPQGLRQRVDWAHSSNLLSPRPSKRKPAAGPAAVGAMALGTEVGVKVERDGAFRIDDVAAGSYDLTIALTEPPSDGSRGNREEAIAKARREVTVPEMPGGRTDEPLDLGEIPLIPVPPRKVLKVSEMAPGFRVETLDGQSLALGDYRGKFVLLDFWATWCGPCLAETPDLKATFDAFGRDERFVMIGLSLDQSKEAPRDYARKNGLRWTQGFLGDWSKTKIPEAYGVNGIPAIWLIGPDGRVVAKDLRGKSIQKAVAVALGKE